MKRIFGGIHQPNWLKFLLLSILVALIGSSMAVYGQEFSDSFETVPHFGDFTLFPSPNSVTFTGGLPRLVDIKDLYKTEDKSFMVNSGNTSTITL